MKKTIAIGLSPNAEGDDVARALRMLFSWRSWRDDEAVERLERRFSLLFGKGYKALAVNSGRSAQYAILKALDIGEGDEVANQALTCVAVTNSTLWTKAKCLFVDIDETLNMDPKDLENKITGDTKAVIIQHSFGTPAKVKMIKKITDKRGIKLIEDCAVSMGATLRGKKVGTLGDVAFFSFGRDKVLSSVFGGMILVRGDKLYERLKIIRDGFDEPSRFWIFQQLFHPVAFSIILPLYNFGFGKLTLGKMILFAFQKLNLLTRAVYDKERLGAMPKHFPKKMPGALAHLALHQLEKLEEYNNKRRQIVKVYFDRLKGIEGLHLPEKKKGAIWLRFPLITKDAGYLFECMKNKGILLGDWYKDVVVPIDSYEALGYQKGSCPIAEETSKTIVNLPTYPKMTKQDAKRVVNEIKSCLTIK